MVYLAVIGLMNHYTHIQYTETKVNAFPFKDIYLKAYRNKPHIKSYRHLVPNLYNMKDILAIFL